MRLKQLLQGKGVWLAHPEFPCDAPNPHATFRYTRVWIGMRGSKQHDALNPTKSYLRIKPYLQRASEVPQPRVASLLDPGNVAGFPLCRQGNRNPGDKESARLCFGLYLAR